MSKRAVIYARVSGDDTRNDGRNVQGQLDMCRAHALEQGWTVVEELAEDDRGASGYLLELPQLNRLLELARAGEFDVVVVREIDRFSRRLSKQLIVEEELKRVGVHIEYVLGAYPATPEGDLMKNIRASIAEYERLKITERMMRGRWLKIKQGSVLVHGQPPFGYRLERHDGKDELVIFEPEAVVIRTVVQWYLEGDEDGKPMGLQPITNKLTKLGIPTALDGASSPRNKKRKEGEWRKATVYKFLTSETYAGTWHYAKVKRDKDRPVTQDRAQLPSVQVPAIITREQWQAVQDRLKANQMGTVHSRKHDYLMSRRLYCSDCGCKMVGVPRYYGKKDGKLYLYYECIAHRRFMVSCAMTGYFPADKVDGAIWAWLKSFLVDPDALLSGLHATQTRQSEEQRPLVERIAVIEDLIVDNRRQMGRLLDLYLTGEFPKELLVERKSRLEATIASLEEEHASLQVSAQTHVLTDGEIRAIQEFTQGISDGLEAAEKDFNLRRQIVERLNVTAKLAKENRQKVVHVQCVLGSAVLDLQSYGYFMP